MAKQPSHVARDRTAYLQILEGHNKQIKDIKFSPNGTVVVSISEKNEIITWDAQTGAMTNRIQACNECWSTAISQDDILIFTRDQKDFSTRTPKELALWDIKASEACGTLPWDSHPSHVLAFSPDGTMLACASELAVGIWNWNDRTMVQHFKQFSPTARIRSMFFDPTNRYFAAQYHQKVVVWDITSGDIHFTYKEDCDMLPISICFIPEHRLLVAGWQSGIRAWDIDTKESRRSIEPPKSKSIKRFVHVPGNNRLITIFDPNHPVQIFEIENPVDEGIPFEEAFESMLFRTDQPEVSPDGRKLATKRYGEDWAGTIRIWDNDSGSLRNVLELPSREPSSKRPSSQTIMAFSPNGNILASVEHAIIHLWDVNKWSERQSSKHPAPSCMAVSDKGYVAVGAMNGTIEIWDSETQKQKISVQDDDTHFVSFSTNGSLLASRSNSTINLWDLHKGVLRRRIPCDLRTSLISFSPDGASITVTPRDLFPTASFLIHWWNIYYGNLSRTLHVDPVDFGQVSHPVCSRGHVPLFLAAASNEGVLVWSLESGGLMKMVRLGAHAKGSASPNPAMGVSQPKSSITHKPYYSGWSSRAKGIAFSPKEDIMVTVDEGGMVQVWGIPGFVQKKIYHLPSEARGLSFCTKGCCIRCDRGVFALKDGPLDVPQKCSDGHVLVFYVNPWLLWRGQRFLYLPPEYRPRDSVGLAVHRNTGRREKGRCRRRRR